MKFDWSIAATMGVVLTVTLVTVAVGRHLKGAELAIFMALMVLLGIAAAAAIIYFKNRGKKPATPAAGGAAAGGSTDPGSGSELDTLIHEADQRLAHANAGATTANLPLIFVIGDRSTAKTSTVINSGIEPELLAGQIYQDNVIGPTRAANLWFARGTAVVEAGGPILGDPASWLRLLKKLQPGKMKSLKGGAQAPRAVLLCVSLEMFSQQGSAEALAGAARYLQARLGEIAQTLGIRFPVYILFTKTDRVPFFTEFVSTFTNDEASQIFGVTVPIRAAQQTGVYAEDETRRLAAYFDNLFYSLCDKRTVFPPRENDIQKVYGAYEFPREVRKLRDLMVRFMVDVCRPNQLMPTNPFLRGFYLTGVRPVVVSEAAPIAAPKPQASEYAGIGGGGATSIFRVGKQAETVAQQSVAQASPVSRKVPQWMFLGHLFSNIILGDTAALSASGSSVKVSALRRGLLIAASALCLILGGIWLWSFLGNRALETQALTAAQHLDSKTVPAADSYPTVGSLEELEKLRASLETLSIYKDDTPFSLRWGLYHGNDMLPEVKRLYFDRFKAVLFGQTQDGLLKIMRGVKAPAGPDDNYDRPYFTLRAYLLTTSEYGRTKPVMVKDKLNTDDRDFLSALLFARWKENRKGDLSKPGLDLALKQFNYYALALSSGYNPYSQDTDASVKNTRAYLDSFQGPQRVYYNLLADTNKIDKPLSFNQYSPGSEVVLISAHPVPFAFTKRGAKDMLDGIAHKDYRGEEWVLGKVTAPSEDRITMQKLVTALYTTDYIKEWREVLKTSKVVPFANLGEAWKKLDTLTGNTAPILALLYWTSQNTYVDVPGVKDAFKTVRSVEPPDAESFIKPVTGYNDALSNLEAAIKTAEEGKFIDADSMKAAKIAEGTARQEAKKVTSLLPLDKDGHLDSIITDLMTKPIPDIHAPSVFDELNPKGGKFCTSFGPITRKFPFDTNSPVDATLPDVAEIFKPKDGLLWKFYNDGLNKVIQCTGGDCVAVPNVPGGAVNPPFLNFFKQAVRLSRALYGDAGDTPNYHYTLIPHKSDQVDSFQVIVNGDTSTKLAGGEQKEYSWPGSSSPSFKLTLNLAGGTGLGYPVQNPDSLWAVFRFFADANQTAAQASTYDFVWDFSTGKHGAAPIIAGRALSFAFTVDTKGAPAVFSKEFLRNMKCVPTVGK